MKKVFLFVLFFLIFFTSKSFSDLQFKQSKDISDDTDDLRGIFIKPDGTRLYVTNDEDKVLYFSRYDIPMNFKKERTLKKQVGLVGFKNKSLQAFCDIKPNVFEETEGIELLRVIGANINLHGVELEFENRSVDTPEDLEFVRNAIITDQLFHKYKHKVKS